MSSWPTDHKPFRERKPLWRFSDRTNGIMLPFPGDWLINIAKKKSLLCTHSYGDYTNMDFLKFVLERLPLTKEGGSCHFLLLPPIPKNLTPKFLKGYFGFNLSYEKKWIHGQPDVKESHPLDEYLKFIYNHTGYGTLIFFDGKDEIIKSLNSTIEPASLLYKTLIQSSSFLFVDFDGFFMIGKDISSGDWHPQILEIVDETI